MKSLMRSFKTLQVPAWIGLDLLCHHDMTCGRGPWLLPCTAAALSSAAPVVDGSSARPELTATSSEAPDLRRSHRREALGTFQVLKRRLSLFLSLRLHVLGKFIVLPLQDAEVLAALGKPNGFSLFTFSSRSEKPTKLRLRD